MSSAVSVRQIVVVLLAAMAAQFLLSSITLPLTELWSAKPLFHIDGVQHWYRIVSAIHLAADGEIVGYDPFFGAGVPIGVAGNPAAKLPAAVAVLAGGSLDPIVVWKLYSFTAGLVAVACVPLALYWLGFARASLWIGALLGLLLWWVSMFRWFHTAGLVSYVLAMYFSVAYVARVMRYANGHGGAGVVVALGLAGALGLLVHPLFPIPVALLTALYVASRLRNIAPARLAALLLIIPAISLLPNLPWIYYQFFETLIVGIPGATHQAIVDPSIVWREFLGIWHQSAQGARVFTLIGLAAVAGCWWARNAARPASIVCFAITGVVLIVYGALGASVEFFADWTQPNRFGVAGYLMLIVPATHGIGQVVSRALQRDGGSRAPRWASLGYTATLLLLTIVSLNELRREISYADIGHYGARPPEVSEPGPYSRFMLAWLTEHTTPDARILFETSGGRIHDGAHMAAYYAYVGQREFIGGPYTVGKFANFGDGWLFGHEIADFQPERLMEYFDLYNIGWVVAHSDASKRYLSAVPGIVPTQRFDTLQTYRVEREPSYFVSGGGRVAARAHNHVMLEELSGDEIILKYHLMPGLTSRPATVLEPVYFLDDPNPFIKIQNPPRKLTLQVD